MIGDNGGGNRERIIWICYEEEAYNRKVILW